jgi:AI-2 transport system permease protein
MIALKKLFEKKEITALLFLVMLFIGVGFRNPDFTNVQSISTVLKGSAHTYFYQ